MEVGQMGESRLLSDAGREILEHSLKGGSNRVYRNHFAADLGTEDGLVCLSLVEQGFMVGRGKTDGMGGLIVFRVTKAGAEAVGLELPHE